VPPLVPELRAELIREDCVCNRTKQGFPERLGKTGRSGCLAPSRAAALLRDHAGKLRSLSKMMSMRQNFQPCGVRTTSVSYCIAPPTR